MCIFPSDGTSRIRFTGQSYQTQSQPDASGPPKTFFALRTVDIIAQKRHLSRKYWAESVLSTLPRKGYAISSARGLPPRM